MIAQPLLTDDGDALGVLVAVTSRQPGPGMVGAIGEVASYAASQLELADLDASRARLDRAEVLALRAQISPHFIYNALNTIASFVRTDPGRARELILEFADFTRYSFRAAGQYTTLSDELRNIDRYLTLERLLEPADVNAISATSEVADASNKGRGAAKPMPVVDDAMLAHAKLYCQAQTTCFSGQTVGIKSGRARSFVTNITPVVGTQAVGYQPTLEVVNSGALLQITPQLSPDGTSVLLDLRSTVTETTSSPRSIGINGTGTPSVVNEAGRPTTEPTVDSAGVIDRPNVVEQSFATTARLPLGKRVLVAGMTLEPAAAGDRSATRQLYLAVEVDAVK